MATNWQEANRLNDEETRRLREKKLKVACIIQEQIEVVMDVILETGGMEDTGEAGRLLGLASVGLERIETIWKVLGLEYVVASERDRREREEKADG